MIVETHDSFRNPRRIQATRVVVRDHLGNPIVVVIEFEPGYYTVCTASDAEFNECLRLLGLENVTVETADTGTSSKLLLPGI